MQGGLGDLTDGVIATANWQNQHLRYMGWHSIDPILTFRFASVVPLNSIRFHFDDSELGGVDNPSGITVSNGRTSQFVAITDPLGTAPFTFDFSSISLIGSSFTVKLHRNNGKWVMVSEVQFTGSNANQPVATGSAKSDGYPSISPPTFAVSRSGETSVAASVDNHVSTSRSNPSNIGSSMLPSRTVQFGAKETIWGITSRLDGDVLPPLSEQFMEILPHANSEASNYTALATGMIRDNDAIQVGIATTNGDTAQTLRVWESSAVVINLGDYPLYVVVPEKLRLSASVGLGHRICVVKTARKDVFQGQNLAIRDRHEAPLRPQNQPVGSVPGSVGTTPESQPSAVHSCKEGRLETLRSRLC